MVTVALSDNQSSSEHTQPEWRNLDIPSTPVNNTHEGESFGPMALQDAARTTPVPISEPSTPTATRDKDVEEEIDNEVDWTNLEKTEEKEPRGEGSDDVGDKKKFAISKERGPLLDQALTFFPLPYTVNGSPTRSPRTRKQCSSHEP
jgi:hypothetical protein